MHAENNRKAVTHRKTNRRILKWVLALAVILIVLMVFFVPALVSSEKGRKIILAKINNSIDGKVDFAGLSMSWWKGIRVTDFRFNDSAGLAFVEIKQITTKPHYGSILSGSLSFGKTVIDEPKAEINLEHPPPDRAESSRQKSSSDKRAQSIILPIKKIDLVVNDGNVKVTDRQAETVAQIKIYKGQFSQVSKAGKTKLQGQVDCEYDWSAVSTVAGPFLAEGLKLQGKRRDTINFTSEYPTGQTDKLLANLNTKAKLGFEKAQYMGLNFGPTEVDIQIQNGLLKIAPFSTTVNTGQFNFAAEADFKKKPTLLRTPAPIEIAKDIQINDETTRRLLMYLNPIFANAVNVSGVANFSCERLAIPLAGATKNDLVVIGTISVNQLRLQASNLLGQILPIVGTSTRAADTTIRPTRFVLQNGFLKYDDMQIDIGDNPVNFEGVIGLDKSLNMTVTLPYTLKGRTARVDKETVGQRISLPLRGTIEKPELDLGKLLEMQLRKQLEQELLKGLEGLFK